MVLSGDQESSQAGHGDDSCRVFPLDSQLLAAIYDGSLCMRTQDVTAKEDGRLIARAFVSTPTLLSLQGSIAAALVSPSMEQVPCRSIIFNTPQ